MNRRGFLGSILALGCAPAIVRASSLMPVRPLFVTAGFETAGFAVRSGSSLLTPTIITREALEILEKNMMFANLVNRRFENYFDNERIVIRKPNRFLA